MERKLDQDLISWKTSKNRKPLLLMGARQVGKTYALKKFAKNEFQNFCYLNFELDPELDRFFSGKKNPHEIVQKISLYTQEKILPEKTLIIFDEIQKSENALLSLKYFYEHFPELPICAAGSLLGIKLGQKGSFPVGKVNFLEVFPMTFSEFLVACGENELVHFVAKSEGDEPLHEKLLVYLQQYLIIGGLPEAVQEFISTHDYSEVRNIQQELLKAYELDFAKYSTPVESLKISSIWGSIPSQIAKENKKFKLSVVKETARMREYETAIQWLVDAKLVLKCPQVSSVKLPLSTYQESNAFKLYAFDVGLLTCQLKIQPKILLDHLDLLSEAKGALVESFVAQELVANQKQLFYWSTQGQAEIDFLIELQQKIIPIEVKSGLSKHKKSLDIYQKKFSPSLRIRCSPNKLHLSKDFANVPLYAISQIFNSSSELLEFHHKFI